MRQALHRGDDPFAADEAVDQRRDVGGLGDRVEAGFQVLDLAAETVGFRIGEQVQDGALLLLIPGVVLGRPVGHVEPLDVADRDRRLHLVLRLDQDGGEVAVPHAERQRDLVEAHAVFANGVTGEEGERAVGVGEAVEDGAAPVVARFYFGGVDPGRVAGGLQVAPDALHQRGVGVVGVAEEHLQAHAAHGGECGYGGARECLFRVVRTFVGIVRRLRSSQ